MDPSLADRSHAWYQAHARRYDRLHPGVAGDLAFYTHLAVGRVVLEIGAGTGRMTEALSAVARSVVAVDYATAMLERARVRLAHCMNVALIAADARALPVLGEFDLVVLPYRVVHHLDAEERWVMWQSVAALLADRGLVAFDTWHGPMSGSRLRAGEPPAAAISVKSVPAEVMAGGLAVMHTCDGFPGQRAAASFGRSWILCKRDFVQERTFTSA
jgi:SAM-dependent methyltransferase